MQAVQRQRGTAAVAAGAAGAAARGRGGAALLVGRAPRAARAHEQAVRGDAGGVSAVSARRQRDCMLYTFPLRMSIFSFPPHLGGGDASPRQMYKTTDGSSTNIVTIFVYYKKYYI